MLSGSAGIYIIEAIANNLRLKVVDLSYNKLGMGCGNECAVKIA